LSKQIEFFFSEEDEVLFTNYIYDNNYLTMDSKANVLTKADIVLSNELSFFITFDGSRIEKRNEFIDQITSEVIQYSRHNSWNNGILSCSRLWAEFKYWNSSKEYVAKSSQLNQTYNTLTKWIKKNTRVSICKHYYIGEQAYHLYNQNKLRMAAGPKNFIEFKL